MAGDWIGPAIAAAGAIGGGVLSFMGKSKASSSAEDAARRQYDYQRLLNEQAYELTQRGYREGPTNLRFGWENAGFNPILALGGSGTSYGTYSGGSASAPMDSSTADMGNMITNAYKTFSLMKDKNKAEIFGIMAGAGAQNAETALKREQAMTELFYRSNLAMDTTLKEAMAIKNSKESSWIDKLNANKILNDTMNAKSNMAIASAQAVNAQTNRLMNAGNIEEAMRDAEWIKKHPYLHSIGKNLPVATGMVSDIGSVFTGFKNATSNRINAINNYNSGYEKTIQRFDARGNYRGHIREYYNRR